MRTEGRFLACGLVALGLALSVVFVSNLQSDTCTGGLESAIGSLEAEPGDDELARTESRAASVRPRRAPAAAEARGPRLGGRALLRVHLVADGAVKLTGREVVLSSYPSRILANSQIKETEADGSVRFSLAPGSYAVQAMLGEELAFVELGPGEEKRVELALGATHIVSGRVVSESGAAIPHARLWMSLPGDFRVGSWCAQTDATGRFEVETCRAAIPSWLAAGHADYAMSWTYRADLVSAEAPIVLPAKRYRVSGIVRDASGRPIPAATLRLAERRFVTTARTRGGKGLYAPPPCVQESDASGRFVFDGLPSHETQLTVSKRGFGSRTITLAVAESSALELELRRAAVLSGKLVSPRAGCDVAGVIVRLRRAQGSGHVTRRTVTDASGRFAFADLAPGDVTLHARVLDEELGEVSGLQTMSLTSGTQNCVLHCERACAIDGLVEPSSGAMRVAKALLLDRHHHVLRSVSVESRRFRFAPVEAQKYRVAFASAGGNLMGASAWVHAPRYALRAEFSGPGKTLELRCDGGVYPNGVITMHFDHLGGLQQSWKVSPSAVQRLAGIRGDGPVRLAYRATGLRARGEHVQETRLVLDAAPVQVASWKLSARSLRFVTTGVAAAWDELRILCSNGQVHYRADAHALRSGDVLPLPDGRACVQILRDGFVVGGRTLDGGEDSTSSFDPSMYLAALDVCRVRIDSKTLLAQADPKSQLRVELVDREAWRQGSVLINEKGQGVALVSRARSYRWRLRGQRELAGAARWMGSELRLQEGESR